MRRPIRPIVSAASGKGPQDSALRSLLPAAQNAAPILTLVGMASLMALMSEPNEATAAVQPAYDLSEGQEFWGNVVRYGRYFVTVMVRQ